MELGEGPPVRVPARAVELVLKDDEEILVVEPLQLQAGIPITVEL